MTSQLRGLLDVLQEECAEVIVAIAKAKRFGLASRYRARENGQAIAEEMGDVTAMIQLVRTHAEFLGTRGDDYERAVLNKRRKLKRWNPKLLT